MFRLKSLTLPRDHKGTVLYYFLKALLFWFSYFFSMTHLAFISVHGMRQGTSFTFASTWTNSLTYQNDHLFPTALECHLCQVSSVPSHQSLFSPLSQSCFIHLFSYLLSTFLYFIYIHIHLYLLLICFSKFQLL